MTLQIPLGLSLPVFKRFETFVTGDNALLVDILHKLAIKEGEQQVMLWGAQGAGKSHLLQAVCDLANQYNLLVSYVPLSHFSDMQPDIVAGLEQVDIVCIDECELIYGNDDWERALFNLINACRETETRMLFASEANPVHAQINLEDLRSRLQWGPVIHLEKLADEQKLAFLQQRAQAKGLVLDDKTAAYILQHYRRDMESLSKLLERLDHASMAAGRRLSVPFVKTVIAEEL